MLEKIPTSDEMTTLVGQDLYDVWQKLCAAIDKSTIWNVFGIKAARRGLTNTNIAGAARRYAGCMQENTA